MNSITKIDCHSFCLLIPEMSEEDYQELKADIEKNELIEPVVIYQGQILDGKHRYQACVELGIEPKFTEFEGDELSALQFVISKNIKRRHLTESQRAAIAAEILPIIEELTRKRQIEEGKDKGYLGADFGYLGGRGHRKNGNGERNPLVSILTQGGFEVKTENTRDQRKARTIAGKILSVSTGYVQTAKKIKSIAPEIFEHVKKGRINLSGADQIVKKAKNQEMIRNIAKQIKTANKKIEVKELLKKIKMDSLEKVNKPIPDGQFNVIYADPPWQYDFCCTDSRKIENHYPTMSPEEIAKIKFTTADDAVLFLWATAPKLREALYVMESWGFTYKTHAVWDKEIIGMGYWFRSQHELLLIGTKGNMNPPEPEKRHPSIIKSKRTEHSKKPEIFYEIIESMYPDGKYLELFARRKYSDKWTVWGNEVNDI